MYILTFFSMVTCVVVCVRLAGELGHFTPMGHHRCPLSITTAANGSLWSVQQLEKSFVTDSTENFCKHNSTQRQNANKDGVYLVNLGNCWDSSVMEVRLHGNINTCWFWNGEADSDIEVVGLGRVIIVCLGDHVRDIDISERDNTMYV